MSRRSGRELNKKSIRRAAESSRVLRLTHTSHHQTTCSQQKRSLTPKSTTAKSALELSSLSIIQKTDASFICEVRQLSDANISMTHKLQIPPDLKGV